MHLEAEDAGLVSSLCFGGKHRGVDLEEDVVERGAEVGAVNYGMTRGLGVVQVLAASAVEFYG